MFKSLNESGMFTAEARPSTGSGRGEPAEPRRTQRVQSSGVQNVQVVQPLRSVQNVERVRGSKVDVQGSKYTLRRSVVPGVRLHNMHYVHTLS